MVPPVREDRPTGVESLDLEAETARRIDLLVARTKQWRSGSIQGSARVEPAIEAAS
jgi:hypothetical protein